MDALFKRFYGYNTGRLMAIAVLVCISISAQAMTLAQAEQVAISRSSELNALKSSSQALAHKAIAVGQLDDPSLKLGAMNLPTDTFNVNQEAMTQMQLGVQQRFPKGRSLTYQSKTYCFLARAEQRRHQLTRLTILRTVRTHWLALYYWLSAKKIIQQQQVVFTHLLRVTESLLANNQAQQKDVIRAQLELSELDNQLIHVEQQTAVARAALARWIGSGLAGNVNPKSLPDWLPIPSQRYLQARVMHHPIVLVDDAKIASNKSTVSVAQERFKPGYTLGVAYGVRSGVNPDTTKRADFLTGQASIDLPIFPEHRQQESLKQAYESLYATKSDRVTDIRDLMKQASERYADWRNFKDSVVLYSRHLVPEAREYTEATQIAYQNALTDFPTLARAHVRNLKIQLDALRAQVDYTQARIALLYLEGQ